MILITLILTLLRGSSVYMTPCMLDFAAMINCGTLVIIFIDDAQNEIIRGEVVTRPYTSQINTQVQQHHMKPQFKGET